MATPYSDSLATARYLYRVDFPYSVVQWDVWLSETVFECVCVDRFFIAFIESIVMS